MNNLLTNFFSDFLCTAFLFVISLFLAIGITTFVNALRITKSVKHRPTVSPPKKRNYTRKNHHKSQHSQTTSARSIEIDPDHIDRILVKKSS